MFSILVTVQHAIGVSTGDNAAPQACALCAIATGDTPGFPLFMFKSLLDCERVDIVRLQEPDTGKPLCDIWIDDDGKNNNKCPNPVATQIARAARGLCEGDYIAGSVVITGPPDPKGETTELSQSAAAWIEEVLEMEGKLVD